MCLFHSAPASPLPIQIPTRFLFVFISTPPLAAELTGSRHTSIAPKVRRSLPVFIPPWLAVRPRKIAGSGVADILFCGKQPFRPCWSNADFSLIRLRRNTPKAVTTAKNSPRKLLAAFSTVPPSPLVLLTLTDHHAWASVCSLFSISVSCANREQNTAATKPPPRKKDRKSVV